MNNFFRTFKIEEIECVIEAVINTLEAEYACASDAGAAEDAQAIRTAINVLTNGNKETMAQNVKDETEQLWNSPICMVDEPDKLSVLNFGRKKL